jgi:3-oxoacyl-[acyl-carrier protein] reductase
MKTAFVTGASRGIGKAIALSLAECGYQVALVAKSKERLEETAEAILKLKVSGNKIAPLIFSLDVSDEKAVELAMQETFRKTGHLDVLVNGAGVLFPGCGDLSSKDFISMIETNLLGAFYCIQAALPYMKKQKSGYIFNISSRAGKTGVTALAGYSASKFGLVGLNDAFSNELAAFGVKMTAICPGWVDTDMSDHAKIPSEEKISVEDINKLVHFLLSLSPSCCVKECILECRLALEKASISPLIEKS